nr:type II and III secretion system protein [Erythrobacter ani]
MSILRALDRPPRAVLIRAAVYEFREGRNKSGGLSILADLFDGRITFGSEASLAPGGQFVGFAVGGLRAVLSRTSGDGRFKLIAQPMLTALDGTTATLNSGAQVPTVGAISFTEDGAPVRSIEYRDSGLNIEFSPTVRGDLIQLAVTQERSSFERTTTGVDDSPTLNRSTTSSTVMLRPGEVAAVAGLDQQSIEETQSGFLGGIFRSRTNSQTKGQIIVLVEASLVEMGSEAEIHFTLFPDNFLGEMKRQTSSEPTQSESTGAQRQSPVGP